MTLQIQPCRTDAILPCSGYSAESRLFDRLMRRAVFAQTDRVVSEHINHALFHQCRHAQRVTAVFREHQESAAERQQTAMQCHAVHNGAMPNSRTPYDVVAGALPCTGCDRASGQVRAGQVGRTAQEFRQNRRPSAVIAFCEALRVAMASAFSLALAIASAAWSASSSRRSSPSMRRSNSAASFGNACLILGELVAPKAFPGPLALGARIPCLVYVL